MIAAIFAVVLLSVAAITFLYLRIDRLEAENGRLESEVARLKLAIELAQRGER